MVSKGLIGNWQLLNTTAVTDMTVTDITVTDITVTDIIISNIVLNPVTDMMPTNEKKKKHLMFGQLIENLEQIEQRHNLLTHASHLTSIKWTTLPVTFNNRVIQLKTLKWVTFQHSRIK